MTPTSDLLLKQTRRYFPRFDDERVEITPIEKGGSDRRFYRVRSSADHSLILVKYNLERGENRHYVQIAEFLSQHEIRAPKIYFHDGAEGLIWIEDLGEADIWSYRDESWMVRRAFYESALEQIVRLHCLPISEADHLRKDFPPEFDAALYTWEQHYFFENCFGRYFKVDERKRAELAALPILSEIADRLAALPRVLVHRDFQSQNIIVRDGHAHLIDFQGMRPGLSKYDLASLLYDPYVDLSLGQREELFGIYRELRARFGNPLRVDDEEIFRLCAMQRLMQALGAYGFLGLVRANGKFLSYIPAAMESLRSITASIPGAENLQSFLEQVV
ncbi:MAG: aminoglycoside phosphotransferase family protein [Verrucomicrobiota bacterium]|nr:aminoglycoside phosphotransferase family protein [Verrucomicrobiota bacterium]